MSSLDERIKDLPALLTEVKAWKSAGEVVVFTNGCFDILHVGHLQTLSRAKAEGDRLIVGLNSDASVQRLKGPSRPINSQQDRARLLAGLRCVDNVIVFTEDTPENVMRTLQPDVHVKGGDYKIEDLPEAALVQEYGGRIVIIDLVPGRSTTGLIEKTKSQ